VADEDQSREGAVLTVSEVAELLRLAPITVSRMARKGEIPGAFRVARHWRFSIKELERWMNTPPTQKE
jgi:excisionase family DNA binding protein